MRLSLIAATLSIGIAGASAEGLPNQCLSSFKVKPEKTIAYFGWLPGGATVGRVMTCGKAEALRQELLKPGGTLVISDSDLQSALAQGNPLALARTDLQKKIAELQNNKPSNLRLWFDVQMFAIAKTQVLYTCLTIETGIGAGACALGVIPLLVSAYDLWGKLPDGPAAQQNAALVAELQKAVKAIDEAMARGSSTKVKIEKARELLLGAQTGLCLEIQKSCL
jgi:hypothetical protein